MQYFAQLAGVPCPVETIAEDPRKAARPMMKAKKTTSQIAAEEIDQKSKKARYNSEGERIPPLRAALGPKSGYRIWDGHGPNWGIRNLGTLLNM